MGVAGPRYEILGPLRVVGADGTDLTPRGAVARRLLSVLLLHRGRIISPDRLAEAVWASSGRADSAPALHSQLFRLRNRIPGLQLEHRPAGYLLDLDDDVIDVWAFEHRVTEGCRVRVSDPRSARLLLDEALGAWRGEPWPELVDLDEGRIEIERLGELHLRAREEGFAARLALGEANDAFPGLEALAAGEPLRERPRELLMEALAATGRRAEALRVYDTYRRRLAEEVGVSPSPLLRARHEALLALDHVATPVAARGERHRTLPPRPISRLVGRDELLAALTGRIRDRRLVTLVGPGGVGKTRLVTEAAHEVSDTFPGGVFFCDLTGARIRSDGEVAEVVASVLRVESRAGVDPLDRLAEALRGERVLLVLDNCEHVVDDAASLVEHLLGTVAGLSVVATSRERLAADGEALLVVEPLACRSAGAGERPDGARHGPAVELLLDRARDVAAAVGPEDIERLVELCERLDGLPLAVEIAASRLSSLTVDEICDGVAQGMEILQGGRRTTGRHRSLEATLWWSIDLLDDDERRSLRAAAAFTGPFDAADIAALLGEPEARSRDRLSALVERSLAVRREARFALLETVRAFAAAHLGAGDHLRLRLGHARRMAEVTASASARLRHAVDDEPISTLRARLPDVRSALHTAVELGDADLALRLVVAARDLAFNAMIPELMTAGESAGELGAAVGHELTADGFAVAAHGKWKTGDLAGMERLVERAESEAERLGIGERFEVLGAVGTVHLAHGSLATGIPLLERAFGLDEISLDVMRRAEGGATLAICRAYAHDPGADDDVAILLEEVAPHAGAVAAAWCWYAAGECCADEPVLARPRLERAVELARRGGSTFVEGVAGATLASLDVRTGDEESVRASVSQYRRLVPLWQRAGVRAPMWTMLRSVVELLAARGETETAALLLGAVLAPGSGHDVTGDDAFRLAEVRSRLQAQLGATRLDSLVSQGAAMDDAAAVSAAMLSLDRLTGDQ